MPKLRLCGAVLLLAALLFSPAQAQAPVSEWQGARNQGDAEMKLGHYAAAIDAYDKAIKAAPDDNAALGGIFTNKGNALLKLNRKDEAVAAYTRAAEVSPNPGQAWFNLCATQYNIGQMKGALASCNKSIQAEPARADSYFIKGSVLFADAKIGANNKFILPPGTVEALQKYLQLAPNGAHASDVKQMLDAAK